MKRIVVLAVIAVLAVPAAAQAKELTAVTFCGANACRTFDHPSMDYASGGDGLLEQVPAPASYYTVRLTVDHEGNKDSWQIFYLPGANMLGLQDERSHASFDTISGTPATLFRNAVRGLKPFAAPTITRVTVSGKAVDDPASYARLFTVRSSGEARIGDPDWQPILLTSSRPSPWTSEELLYFSPSTGILQRAGEFIKLPKELSSAIAAGGSLDAPSSGGDGGFDWPLVSGSLAVMAVLTLATLVLIRRRTPPATA
jgi:hypothetical protein